MRTSSIIALREFKERISSRSFLFMAFFGPLMVLGLTYALFALGGKEHQHWKVLITDKAGIFEQKIVSKEDPNIVYSFANDYIEIADFASNPAYAKYDAMVEINEKILTNKSSFLFYREKPSFTMSVNIRYQVERRLEEVISTEFQKMSLTDFRKIKQPLVMGFRNVYDPTNTASDLAGWVGLFFGAVIFVFIFLFGMTILRSVAREKSNRIVEVLLATVHPRALMLGKIVGIGCSALVQFIIWVGLIGAGLYALRESIFIDIYDPSNVAANVTSDYNQFVELVFERIQFGPMLFYFVLFFILGYLFYGAFFAALGAVSGSESDGQQFLLPLIALLLFALYAGYFVVNNPESSLSTFFQYFPFTAPVVVMVKLAMGAFVGVGYQLVLIVLIMTLSTFGVVALAGRLYKNGLLQFGHTIRLKTLFTWMNTK
jgi:ABC-2 type transport system permease protein